MSDELEELPELSEDELDKLDPEDEPGGDAGPHPVFTFPPVLVGPATSGQINTIEEWIRPQACWRLDDTRFEFDSSFVKPAAARELRLLEETRDENPGARISIFGHADPSGRDDYNKTLSGRRARAIYAMLIRDPAIWDELFNTRTPGGGDPWGKPALEVMLTTVGRDPSEAASMTKDQRLALYVDYMNRLCGPKLKLSATADFLVRGAGDDLRGDVQGCSEFNAVVRFSKKEEADFSQLKNKSTRDSENAPNRRVVAYFFRKELEPDAKEWPCPSSKAGPALCRKRFWSDEAKRKAPAPERREFAKDKNTFQCRFYHRLAIQSPCEESVLSALLKIRVRLRLMYRDPLGVERPFPKGVRVLAVCADGTSRRAKVGDEGRVRFVLERSKVSFILDFETTDQPSFANAGPSSKATPVDKLVPEEETEAAALEGYRMFQVPAVWSTRDTDWPVVESPLFAKGEFTGFENPAVLIGTPASPVKMVLDPHWQFLRYEYFDRTLLKKLPAPPVFVQGFRLADLAAGTPDTRSNWTTPQGNQCLPWILRDIKAPDKDSVIELRFDKRLFIETKKDGSRTIVTPDASGAAGTVQPDLVNKPGPERLRFYDLPELWQSKAYFARLGGSKDFFEKLADKATSDGQPLLFCLDDIVFASQSGAKVTPGAWDPVNDRIATFSHQVHKGIDKGLFQPDSPETWLSKKPTTITDRNYLADYPDWTRFIIKRGNIFDVFNTRTSDADKPPVGARAAVLMADGTTGTGPPSAATNATATSAFTSVEIAFAQSHPNRGTIGRGDFACFRCCDRVGDDEVAVHLHYFRLNFDFSPAPIPARNTTPNTIAAGNQNAFVKKGIENIMKRWNGPDGDFNKANGVVITPIGGAKLRTPILWFAQAFPQPLSGTLNKNEVQYIVDIFKDCRAFMSAGRGRGAIEQTENAPDGNGTFTLAHELGHGDSLEDEYIETHNHCSYHQPGYEDFIPGSPFFGDGDAIMKGNRIVRPRHFWHVAEWMRKQYATEFLIQHDGFAFKLPQHTSAPSKTFVTDTWVPAARNTGANGGFCDLFLFRLGLEEFSFRVLNRGPFDGFLSVVVRMKLTFPHNDHDDLLDQTGKIRSGIIDRLNGKFFVQGKANGLDFDKCRLSFSPRFLVTNDSNNTKYHTEVGVTPTTNYGTLVGNVETTFGTHYTVTLTRSGTSRLTPGAGALGSLTFNMRADDIEDDFPVFFAGMLGVSRANVDNPASYEPLVKAVIPDAKVRPL
jgi:hypothetical protein